jgi:putative redox protein
MTNRKNKDNNMHITLRQISGLAMATVGDSGHWVTTDGPEKFGGFSAGSRPMELLLMGLATCTAMDVVSILRKKRVKLNDFRMEVEAEQAPEHPKVFTNIKLHYIFTGSNIRPSDVEQAIELSENKYCSVSAMLKKSVNITYDYKIIDSEDETKNSTAG